MKASNSHIDIVDTKTKILAVANDLFARQGFDGVSIRDIAQEADVNVASINYHFKNKLNLLYEIFDYNYKWMEKEVGNLVKGRDLDAPTLAWEMYQLFFSHSSVIINSFKMILSEHLCSSSDFNPIGDDGHFGPPGGEYLLQAITKEVGEEVPFQKREWAMRMIFSNIFHFSIMMNTSYLKRKCSQEHWMSEEGRREDIKGLATALIESLKKMQNS